MKIGITGANGLVGSNLIKSLMIKSYDLKILIRNDKKNFKENSKLQIFKLDLINPNIDLSEFLSDLNILIHCAAEIKDEKKMDKLHIEGTQNLINQILRCPTMMQFIYISSVGVYGFPNKGEITEKFPLKYTNEYERTKLEGEYIIKNSLNTHPNINYTILRPGPIISPNMKNNYLLSLIKYIDEEKFFFIGNTKTIFNYIDTSNLVDAIIAILNHDKSKNEVFNLCDQVPLRELVFSVKKILKKNNRTYNLPYFFVKIICALGSLYPNFPLTMSRFKVLTNQSSFIDHKFQTTFKFKKKKLFEETIFDFISEYLN